jgi:SAM-dependent methyltransferase
MKVSIFTPTNNNKFLPELYASIKDQDFYEWVVLYNNGGEPLEFGDPRVKSHVLFKAPEWVGPLKAKACSLASGDILLEVDHDDMLTPNAIAQVKEAFKDPEIGFIYSNTLHSFKDHFPEIYGWNYRPYNDDWEEHISFPPTPESISRIWFAPNHLRAFRKTIYDVIGGYNTEMRILDDLDLMCRMYLVTKFKHIDQGLYFYRVHGENTWLRYNKEIQDNVYRIYDQYIDKMVERFCDLNGLRKIELGGRFNNRFNYEVIDLVEGTTIADLNKRWPIADNTVGVIRALDILEHLEDPIFVMKEASRVLVPGGWLMCKVPSTDGRGAFQDPTHKSFWNENSFHYYTKQTKAKYIDTPVRFQSSRLYTTDKNDEQVCWTIAHLINLKDGYRPPGLIEI